MDAICHLLFAGVDFDEVSADISADGSAFAQHLNELF
jgi:hypothetical protein